MKRMKCKSGVVRPPGKIKIKRKIFQDKLVTFGKLRFKESDKGSANFLKCFSVKAVFNHTPRRFLAKFTVQTTACTHRYTG